MHAVKILNIVFHSRLSTERDVWIWICQFLVFRTFQGWRDTGSLLLRLVAGVRTCVRVRSRMPMTSRGQLTVEKTPSYFVTTGAAERVYNMSRDVHLLVVVRDPVTRALSQFTQAQSRRRQRSYSDRPTSFERRAFIDDDRTLVDTSWSAINVGLYARHLRRWLDVFPRRQIHLVHGERLVTDPADQLADVQTFLGLRPVITRRHFHFNATKGFPCLRTRSETVRCLGKTKGRVHPSVDGDVLRKLRDFYRPHNAQLYALTGIDFGWMWARHCLVHVPGASFSLDLHYLKCCISCALVKYISRASHFRNQATLQFPKVAPRALFRFVKDKWEI